MFICNIEDVSRLIYFFTDILYDISKIELDIITDFQSFHERLKSFIKKDLISTSSRAKITQRCTWRTYEYDSSSYYSVLV